MQIGMWYWNTPFAIMPSQAKLLDEIGVTTLYVRTSTFTTDGKRLKRSVPQTWGAQSGSQKVVLTFNFDGGLRSHLSELPVETMARDVAAGIGRSRKEAVAQGIKVSGFQMDVDCPTRLLPKYAELLVKIRQRLVANGDLQPGQSFSATALQTWLNSRHYQDLADACDFVVPQFYEGEIGRSIDRIHPISDTDNLVPGMNRADRTGHPFFAGLGIYGHSLLFSPKGKLIGTYHGLKPEEALRHPSLETQSEIALDDWGHQADPKQYIGENLLVLRAMKPDQFGQGLGVKIAYWVPTAEMLRRELNIVRTSRPSNCQGMILYRFPEPTDALSLPLPTVRAAILGEETQPSLDIKMSRKAVPWSLIGTEKTAKGPPYEYHLTLRSLGDVPTDVSPHALGILLRFSGEGIDLAELGAFDSVIPGIVSSEGSFQPCALPHANALILKSFYLGPGATLRSGAIRVAADGPKLEKVEYHAKFNGGFVPYLGSNEPRF